MKSVVEIYKSRHTPGVTGSEILWRIGERAICRNMKPEDNGRIVTIQSALKTHSKAPGNGIVLEVFFEGEDPILHAVLADNLLPHD